jgi:hypothetical protein
MYRKFIKFIGFVAGLTFAATGVVMLFAAASGAVVKGQTGAYVMGLGWLATAVPLLVLPFSSRLAARIGAIVLAAFGLFALWVAFGSRMPAPLSFQFAAVAFGMLLLVRVGLALRRKRSGMGT